MSDNIRIDVIETVDSVSVTITEQNRATINISESARWGNITGTLSEQTDLQTALNAKENISNKVTAFQSVPDNTHYPSEKLVKDQLDSKIDKWNVDYLDFNLLDGFTQQKGRLQWDAENDTLQIGLNNNVNLQIGQEQLIYVYNESGADIPDGKLVYFTGVHAQRPTMALADNRNYATSLVTGMTTETIGNHSYGYVCIQGIVHGLNTHGLTAGDRLWLGQDGNYTITRPTSPLSQVRIGTILYDNPVDGEIYVYLRPTTILTDLSDVLVTNLENGNTLYWDTNVWKNTPKTRITPEGGIAIKLTNRTGANTIKGYCVTTDTVNDNAVKLVPIDAPNCIGVFYESGIADGAEAWVVVAGIADVYFWGSTTRGYLARTGLSTDTGEISGQALSEAIPTSPFATDKHFCEIGHILETRSGAGLAKVVLHFN